MTKDEFIKSYCKKSNITWKDLSKTEVVLPCRCGETNCLGWAIVRNNPSIIKLHEIQNN